MSGQPLTLRLASGDDVVIARVALSPGDVVNDDDEVENGERAMVVTTSVPAGHKVAVRPLEKGAPVHKLGQVIGVATSDIGPGDHVHVHNCAHIDRDIEYAPCSRARPTPFVPEAERRGFEGYRRSSGAVGTRNYIGLLTTVNCAATVTRHACQRIEASGLLDDYPSVDGIVPIIHSTGCGMASSGPGMEILRRTLAGYARHPNFAGVLTIGLGCEVCQARDFFASEGLEESETLRTLTIQGSHGTLRTIAAVEAAVREMLPAAQSHERSWVPCSELKLALQCGGSDGYSTITANPALGVAADLLVRNGGTAILSETPEIYGAEHLLVARAQTPDVAQSLIDLVSWWRRYVDHHGGSLDNNPSPGNREGGITTILEKSLGATAKGGSTNITGVHRYAEPIGTPGLVFMDSPGYDPCSVTGQVASGANVICFTTGRGSVFGNRPCPSIKIATSSELYRSMPEDMDFDAGRVADGSLSVEEAGASLFEMILDVASGTTTKSERLGFGNDEFVPWQIGAVM